MNRSPRIEGQKWEWARLPRPILAVDAVSNTTLKRVVMYLCLETSRGRGREKEREKERERERKRVSERDRKITNYLQVAKKNLLRGSEKNHAFFCCCSNTTFSFIRVFRITRLILRKCTIELIYANAYRIYLVPIIIKYNNCIKLFSIVKY